MSETPTPRTNNRSMELIHHDDLQRYRLMMSHAKTLETELTAATARIAELEAGVKTLTAWLDQERRDGKARIMMLESECEGLRNKLREVEGRCKRWASKVDDIEAALSTANECIGELEKSAKQDQRAPGMWGCKTCGFVLMKSILAVNAGEIFADTKLHAESCPNDGDVMFPYTYKQLAKENQDIGEAAIIRSRKLEAELARLRA